VLRILCLLVYAACIAPAFAVTTPAAFNPVIGARIDLSLPLTDEAGVTQPLAKTIGNRPAIVLWGYDLCPNLCGVAQGAVADALAKTGLAAGGYSALFLTVDPTETRQDAADAHAKLLAADAAAAGEPWHFLGGSGVSALEAQFGIGVEQRSRIAQFVHPVGAIVLTSDGRISRVLPGLDFDPRDLRLALVEASEGKLGTLFEHILLLCAGFDTSRGQYTPTVVFALQVAAAVTLALLGALLLLLRRREPKA
jgi:protein SCO1/2